MEGLRQKKITCRRGEVWCVTIKGCRQLAHRQDTTTGAAWVRACVIGRREERDSGLGETGRGEMSASEPARERETEVAHDYHHLLHTRMVGPLHVMARSVLFAVAAAMLCRTGRDAVAASSLIQQGSDNMAGFMQRFYEVQRRKGDRERDVFPSFAK